MFPIRPENQPKKITLMYVFPEALIGIIGELIRLQIEHRNRLHGHGLLRAIAIVQQCGVAAIWTDRDRRRKTVGAADSTRSRDRQGLTGRQRDRGVVVGFTFLRRKRYVQRENCNQNKNAGESNHGASAVRSAKTDLQKRR